MNRIVARQREVCSRSKGGGFTNSWRYVRSRSHEAHHTGASRILGSLLSSVEEKCKRKPREGQRSGKVSSSWMCGVEG